MMKGVTLLKIKVQNKDLIIAKNCSHANTFLKRLKGLLGKKKFLENEGLYIPHCNSIHMFFMRFPIDVVFLDHNKKIVFLLEEFSPWKIKFPVSKARDTIELPQKTIQKYGLEIGDLLVFFD